MTDAPRVKLVELREYVSERSGKHYLSGFLGGARVLIMRDDRAEITGREVARWAVYLEQQQPREDRTKAQDSRGSATAAPGPRRAPVRPAQRQKSVSPKDSTRRRGRRATAERHATELLRGRGIDPAADPPNDPLPF